MAYSRVGILRKCICDLDIVEIELSIVVPIILSRIGPAIETLIKELGGICRSTGTPDPLQE